MAVFRTYEDLGRYELERTALSLAFHGVYGNPYAFATGPTAHVSPGYTLILAAVFRLFGDGIPGEIVKELLACFVTSIQYALVPWAAEALGLGRSSGLLAAFICALYPSKPLVQIDGDWETPYTALFLVLICASATKLWRNVRLSISRAIKHGLLWGIALLFASVVLPILFAYVAAGLWFRRREFWPFLRFSVLQIVVVIVCLLPWAIRNEISLGEPIFTRSNLGLELRVSNNDEASADQRENYLHGVYARYHPLQNATEAGKVRSMGEVAYNAWAQHEAERWISSHPQRYLELTLERVEKFWFYNDPTSVGKSIFLFLSGFLGLIGAVYLARIDLRVGTAVCLVLCLYPAPSYLIHVGLRQRYPVDWLLTLLSAFVVYRLLDKFRTRQTSAHAAKLL